MEITTKYNIGDEVYFINNNKVCKDIITSVHITYDIYKDKQHSQKNIYCLKNPHKNNLGGLRYEVLFTDDNLFLKKEDLINSL
jgi:hypothetical protein